MHLESELLLTSWRWWANNTAIATVAHVALSMVIQMVLKNKHEQLKQKHECNTRGERGERSRDIKYRGEMPDAT